MAAGEFPRRRVLLLPSSGMGHLIPFVRLAAALSSRNISTSILAVRPTISAAESHLLSSLPPSLLVDFPLPRLDPSLFPPSSDPFFLQMEAFCRSVHLVPSLISTLSPPFSSFIIDIAIASTFLPIAAATNIPCFVLFPSSASMLALCSAFPLLVPHPEETDVEIACGRFKIRSFSLPPPLSDPNHLFTTNFVENGKALGQATGILVNTFTAFEPEILDALNAGEVRNGLPPVIAIGPLPGMKKEPPLRTPAIKWLDLQPEKSVLYVSFGSRTAMSREQIGELAGGLEMSGCRFLWVVKTAKVDREDEVEIGELLGEDYLKRVENRGMIVKVWVEQEEILGHNSVAGFLSHCGWNSVTEAAAAGVPMIGWPRMGDQRVNAESVRKSGLGIWPENWPWEAEEGVVTAEEIAVKVREVMGDEKVAETAAKVRAAATAAVEVGGSSDQGFCCLMGKLLSTSSGHQ